MRFRASTTSPSSTRASSGASRSAARSCAGSGTGTWPRPARSLPRRSSPPGSLGSSARRRRTRSTCRRTAATTSPSRRGERARAVDVAARVPPLAGRRFHGLIGFNLFTAIAPGIGGFFLCTYLGGQIAVGKDYLIGTDQNDVGIFMGFLFATIGWLGGLGFFNYPVARLLGRPPA